MRCCKITVLCAAFLLLPAFACAQWEVEAHPTAYALKGFSAHVGYPIFDGRSRLQLGGFGADTPQWIHGNAGFTESSRGATFKIDYFPRQPSRGLFFGADSNFSRVRYELDETHGRVHRSMVGLGPRAGYRFDISQHLYIYPWISVDYQFGAKDVTISGKTFHESKYSVFPAVHIGWRF